jgi:biopolymer transport protein ExbB/TolQ
MDNPIYTLSQVAIFLCILYLMFIKEFVKKKGANLADKQDIEDITEKIEQVKNQFTQENEHLKANLQFLINNQLQNSNEERNAIMMFTMLTANGLI